MKNIFLVLAFLTACIGSYYLGKMNQQTETVERALKIEKTEINIQELEIIIFGETQL